LGEAAMNLEEDLDWLASGAGLFFFFLEIKK
jgi:hypothetical protein